MTSLVERKNKGKAPAQDYSQDKRGSTRLPFVMHEGASSRVNPDGSKSFQEFVPAEVTYSSGDMVITLQEILSRSLQFHNGTYIELPNSIKFILDNLQAAFTLKHHTFFQKTPQALEIHLVNTTAINEAYICQLFGKEDIHSKDKKTVMGTDYARLSLKTQSLLRSAIANLPTEIQFCILESKAMLRSFDLWFEYFKILVTTAIPDVANSDDLSDIQEQADWKEHFGSSLRVYEKKHLFPGLLVYYEDGSDDADRDPNWLSQMFEYGFIRLIKLKSLDHASQLPQIIQMAVKKFKSPFVSTRCLSTLPKWEKDNWMNVQPLKHLVLINGYTYQ